MDDGRSYVSSGIVTGLPIWKSAVLPCLLFNAECWINKSSLQQLEQLQLKFYWSLLAVGSGCPLLYWDTGEIYFPGRLGGLVGGWVVDGWLCGVNRD